MTAPFPSPGDHIGRFRVLRQLGAGGMGVVYDALEVNLERRVALKVISPLFADDPDFRRRFIREARLLASLDSPHVVQVYAHGEEDGYLYIATQLVADGDLGQMITRWGPAPLGKAVELIEQVAGGLADAHAAGLVHRDIKPANVLVRRRGAATVHAYLGDFGIARRVGADATQVGTSLVAGTPLYMAPELHGGAQASVATDIYSLGCLLWVALTGEPPYSGTSGFEIVGGHVTKPVPQLAPASPLAEAVNRVLRISMAKESGHRYRSALTLREDLRDAARMSDDVNHLRMASRLTSRPASSPARSAAPGSSPFVSPAVAPAPVGPPSGLPLAPAPPAAPTRSRRGWWVGVGAAVTAVVVGATTALVLEQEAGGGGRSAEAQAFADSSAADIILEAEKDMRVLRSVRVTGTTTTDGQDSGIDLVVTAVGDCDGQLTLGGGTAAVRRIDGEAWLKPDRAFVEASADAATDVDAFVELVGDSWVMADAEQADDFGDLCDLDELLEGDGSDPVATKGAIEEVAGVEVVVIEQRDDAGTTTVHVRLEAPHHVLRLESDVDQGSYRLSEFDEPFTAIAPPDDEVIDPADLAGG